MATVIVNSGICGFKTTITATSDDMQNTEIVIKTDCPNIKPLEDELKEADGFEECFSKLGDSPIYRLAKNYCKHASCPVPSAIIKAVEVACGLALPKDVEFKITRD